MKKGDVVTGTVERIDFPNKAIVDVGEGQYVTVKNLLPGQKVDIRITKKRHGQMEGRLVKQVERGDKEIPSLCPYNHICGGCIYQTLPYEEELKIKESMVQRILKGHVDEADYDGILGSDIITGYRNKMEYTFGNEYKEGPMTLGMHRAGGHVDVIDVPKCQIADEDFGLVLKATVDFFAGRQVPFMNKFTHKGFLRHLVLRKSGNTGEMLVMPVTCSHLAGIPEGEDNIKDDREEIKKLLDDYVNMLCELAPNNDNTGNNGFESIQLKNNRIVGVVHIINDSPADAVICQRSEVLYGRDYFYEELLGLKFKVSPMSFLQNNSRGAEILYSKVREYLNLDEKSKAKVFDLYSGTGTITQVIAPVCESVLGIEIVEEAVESARENARLNGLDNVSFMAGDVWACLQKVEEKPDYIIVDPPREGITPKSLAKILDYNVDRIIYVSCKASSLATDLLMCKERGYRVVKYALVDLFPRTTGIETVCLLVKERGIQDRESHLLL
ncbi:MAG: class I SAM-dependent RNA methyltransferase [Lachnospiraceae bacterium]|nr:class I SAM-dependent RNA methyltransferase [Lachnospiraceae bacterium]